jgi:hypothetical protein
MKLFGIRHKPSQRMMPAIRGRGSTGLNFHLDDFEKEFAKHKLRKEPRLFASRTAVNLALRAWLKGEWKEESSVSGLDGEYDVYTVPPAKPPADRKAEEMEIVEFDLVETKK